VNLPSLFTNRSKSFAGGDEEEEEDGDDDEDDGMECGPVGGVAVTVAVAVTVTVAGVDKGFARLPAEVVPTPNSNPKSLAPAKSYCDTKALNQTKQNKTKQIKSSQDSEPS